ncbi:MAG: hypothetical protein VXW65_08055, partial [Pseudomonadota bacterium]|nr:hypothetical protein [Pseudomonadota bacterium]
MSQRFAFQWRRLDPIAPWLLAAAVLWLCWQIAAVIWLIAAPPQPPYARDIALTQQQQAATPNISGFSLFKVERAELPDRQQPSAMSVPMQLQGVMISRPMSGSSAVI